ncbi:sucrase ferredoxin [Rhizohabitans arisaemae]|uniref:sucrase ferredoxin n=1 Tax=Rhizohabitans arisaemae TaxID=2720610 RepID=UPI0024B25F7A|nr:sucrase ferredoxin [Rhizohabitans arisaemae]
MLASATVGARSWLLIEHPGPWAAYLDECTSLPRHLRDLIEHAKDLGIRPQLIRKPGRRRGAGVPRLIGGWSAGDDPWLAEGTLEAPDLEPLARGEVPPRWKRIFSPIFLVCTHAKRNACCARLGLPLARSLHAIWPDNVWETTHVGGDRYAANLVCLPHGLYYGSMSQAAAVAAAEAYRRGEVVLDRFRGRSGIPEPLQAAEHFVRAHTGELTLGGVVVESTGTDGDATVALVRTTARNGGGARYQVVIERVAYAAPCDTVGACADAITTYRLVELSQFATSAMA